MSYEKCATDNLWKVVFCKT